MLILYRLERLQKTRDGFWQKAIIPMNHLDGTVADAESADDFIYRWDNIPTQKKKEWEQDKHIEIRKYYKIALQEIKRVKRYITWIINLEFGFALFIVYHIIAVALSVFALPFVDSLIEWIEEYQVFALSLFIFLVLISLVFIGSISITLFTDKIISKSNLRLVGKMKGGD